MACPEQRTTYTVNLDAEFGVMSENPTFASYSGTVTGSLELGSFVGVLSLLDGFTEPFANPTLDVTLSYSGTSWIITSEEILGTALIVESSPVGECDPELGIPYIMPLTDDKIAYGYVYYDGEPTTTIIPTTTPEPTTTLSPCPEKTCIKITSNVSINFGEDVTYEGSVFGDLNTKIFTGTLFNVDNNADIVIATLYYEGGFWKISYEYGFENFILTDALASDPCTPDFNGNNYGYSQNDEELTIYIVAELSECGGTTSTSTSTLEPPPPTPRPTPPPPPITTSTTGDPSSTTTTTTRDCCLPTPKPPIINNPSSLGFTTISGRPNRLVTSRPPRSNPLNPSINITTTLPPVLTTTTTEQPQTSPDITLPPTCEIPCKKLGF